MSADETSTVGATRTGEWTPRRLALWAGPAAVVVSVVAIFGSVALASWVVGSWFTWTGNALSHLGASDRAVAPLFNYGLVVAGVLGVAFAWRVWIAAANNWHRLGAALLGLALANSALVGVFNVPHPLHGPTALAYFVLFTLGLFAHGSGDAFAGLPRRGVLSIWLAVAHVAGWVVFGFLPFDGIAIPEQIGVFGLWIWTLKVFVDIRG